MYSNSSNTFYNIIAFACLHILKMARETPHKSSKFWIVSTLSAHFALLSLTNSFIIVLFPILHHQSTNTVIWIGLMPVCNSWEMGVNPKWLPATLRTMQIHCFIQFAFQSSTLVFWLIFLRYNRVKLKNHIKLLEQHFRLLINLLICMFRKWREISLKLKWPPDPPWSIFQ